jgi:exodeoxyribonuclease VII small subunit
MQACAPPRPGTSLMTSKPGTADAALSGVAEFERSLGELENIVARLEQGELSLEESLQQFERGVGLTRICQNALQQAEQKIEVLMRQSEVLRQGNGTAAGTDAEFVAVPFQPGHDTAES